MNHRIAIVAAAVTLASAAGAQSVATGAAAPAPPDAYAADDPTFYDVPDSIPAGEHGDLIRYQPIEFALPGVTLTRVMYLSETVVGEPTVVTGVVTVGDGPAPDGGWRLLLHGHGTTGLADECAPSVSLGGNGMDALEIGLLAGLAPPRGFAVSSTDYEGLGGPGVHPYLVGISEGRSMLDAGLAARQLPGADIGDVTAIAGYSQGGHAALWAHQIAEDWTPDMPIVGTLSGAPASELTDVVRDAWERGGVERTAAFALLAGLAASSPEAADAVDAVLSPDGRRLVAMYGGDTCEFSFVAGDGAGFLTDDPSTIEPLASMIAANVPGDVAADAPLLIVHSDNDESVPIDATASLLERECAADQVVERRVLVDGPTHVEAAVPAYTQGLDWLAGFVDGAVPLSSCAGG